jgi:hypothetical protein
MTYDGTEQYPRFLTLSLLLHRMRSVQEGVLFFSLRLNESEERDLVSNTVVPISYLYVGLKVIGAHI